MRGWIQNVCFVCQGGTLHSMGLEYSTQGTKFLYVRWSEHRLVYEKTGSKKPLGVKFSESGRAENNTHSGGMAKSDRVDLYTSMKQMWVKASQFLLEYYILSFLHVEAAKLWWYIFRSFEMMVPMVSFQWLRNTDLEGIFHPKIKIVIYTPSCTVHS